MALFPPFDQAISSISRFICLRSRSRSCNGKTQIQYIVGWIDVLWVSIQLTWLQNFSTRGMAGVKNLTLCFSCRTEKRKKERPKKKMTGLFWVPLATTIVFAILSILQGGPLGQQKYSIDIISRLGTCRSSSPFWVYVCHGHNIIIIWYTQYDS